MKKLLGILVLGLLLTSNSYSATEAERVFNNLVFCKNSTGDIQIDINKNCSGSYKKLSKLESINTVEEFEICYKKSSALIINTSIFSRKCNRDWSEYKIKYDGQNFFYGDSNAKKITQTDDSSNVVQQLKDLNELYESGVLTEEEFNKAKKKLLN